MLTRNATTTKGYSKSPNPQKANALTPDMSNERKESIHANVFATTLPLGCTCSQSSPACAEATSYDGVCVREKLVTAALDAVLSPKKPEAPTIESIFDGKYQGQLMALACFKPSGCHAFSGMHAWADPASSCGASTHALQWIKPIAGCDCQMRVRP
jgi:hypothetical protein